MISETAMKSSAILAETTWKFSRSLCAQVEKHCWYSSAVHVQIARSVKLFDTQVRKDIGISNVILVDSPGMIDCPAIRDTRPFGMDALRSINGNSSRNLDPNPYDRCVFVGPTFLERRGAE